MVDQLFEQSIEKGFNTGKFDLSQSSTNGLWECFRILRLLSLVLIKNGTPHIARKCKTNMFGNMT